MRLGLIYPPFYHKKFNENLPTVDDEFGIFPHIGFGWVSAAAKLTGAEVRLFDAAAEKKPFEQVLQEVRDFNPDVLGFSAHAVQTFRDMLAWAMRFKAELGLPQLVGGYEAKVYAADVMEHSCFDWCCVGEAIGTVPPFLHALERGSGFSKVPDLVFRRGTGLVRTQPGPRIPFAEHPECDRSIFPNHLYYSQISQRKNFTIGMTSVGCPYQCTYCAVRDSSFDARSPMQVVDEMERAMQLYGIREFDWFDPIMLLNRRRALDIAHEIQRRKLDVIWSTRTRVDSLSFHSTEKEPDEELIREIAASGCRRLLFGVESGDDVILRNVHKSQEIRHLKRTLDCVAAHGIRCLGFFMVGNPGETVESARRTAKYAPTLPLDYAQFTITVMKPHSDLEKEHMVACTGMDYWREFIRGTVPEQILPTPWTELSRAELEKLAREGYIRFYVRPRYIWKMIRRLESFEEFARYVRVGIQLLMRPVRPLLGQDGRVSPLRRFGRAAFAFLEGALATTVRTARHPVQSYGGGLKGAWKLAVLEWIRSGIQVEVAAPGTPEMPAIPNPVPVRPPEEAEFHGRYLPISTSALQARRTKTLEAAPSDIPLVEV